MRRTDLPELRRQRVGRRGGGHSEKPGVVGGCPGCVQGIRTLNAALVYSKERDGRVTDFRLLPGRYAVWYGYYRPRHCHGQIYGLVDRIDTVELRSGRVYRVRLERNEWIARCGADRREIDQPQVWIDDQTTDQVVAGDKAAKGTP